MSGLDDFSEEVVQSSSASQLFTLLDRHLNERGYNQRALVLVNDHPSLRMPKQTLQYNFAPPWRKHYAEQGYLAQDPVLTELYTFNGEPYYWDRLEKLKLKRKQQQILSEGRAAGLHHGVAIPLISFTGELACLSIASSDPHLNTNDTSLMALFLIANGVFNRYRSLVSSGLVGVWSELDVPARFIKLIPLLHLQVKHISRLLHLTEATVKTYVRDLCELLQARGYPVHSKENAYQFFQTYAVRHSSHIHST